MQIDIGSEGSRFIERFIHRLRDTRRVADIKPLFCDTVDCLGYAHFAYHIIRTPLLDHRQLRMTLGLANYPENWQNCYIDSDYVYDDPVIEWALTSRKPFLWNDVLAEMGLNKKQAQIISDASDIGIRGGLTIPLSSQHGERAALNLIPAPGRTRSGSGTGLIHLIAELFHAHALRLVLQEEMARNKKRPHSILSPREQETISWVARGKSSWEIAQILGIAEKSVEFYVDSAKCKLQASNRTHVVAKAMMLGLVAHLDEEESKIIHQSSKSQSGNGKKANYRRGKTQGIYPERVHDCSDAKPSSHDVMDASCGFREPVRNQEINHNPVPAPQAKHRRRIDRAKHMTSVDLLDKAFARTIN